MTTTIGGRRTQPPHALASPLRNGAGRLAGSLWLSLALAFALALIAPGSPANAQAGAQASAQASAPPPTAASTSSPGGTQRPPAAEGHSDDRLGAGDVVRISVYQNPDLALEARLPESGRISFPLIGSVRLGGSTPSGAETLIADGLRLGGFVRQPQVSVTLLQARSRQANVLGQVQRPGRYALDTPALRLSDLLALAGGATTSASDRVVISGTRAERPFRHEVDLPQLFTPGGRERDLAIQAGDTVWVDRQPLVYIYGEVQRPGALRLERGMTLMQALAVGGGLSPRGTERGIKVHRLEGEGTAVRLELKMDDRLLDGDVVFVRESLF